MMYVLRYWSWIVFGTLFFFHPMRFLAMGHVTRHMFKRCKQTRCQINIFFYLNFFCFCFIIFYSYTFVLFLLYFVENRTVLIWSVSNGYCIMDHKGTVHWIEPYEPLKKTGVDIRLKRRKFDSAPLCRRHKHLYGFRFNLSIRESYN